MTGVPLVVQTIPLEEVDFTPTERRLVQLLQTGKPRTKYDLKKCLDDDLSVNPDGLLRVHMHGVRSKLPPEYVVVCEYRNRIIHYRLAYHYVPPPMTLNGEG